MNANEILNMLGKSVNDEEIQFLLKENKFSKPKSEYYVESLFGKSLDLEFRVKFSYDEIYYGVKSEYIDVPFKTEYELILEGISFKKKFPFNLTLESTKEDIKKIGKIYNKSTKDLWYVIKDDYNFSINFKNDKIYHISIEKQTLAFKQNIKILNELKEQSKNINPINIDRVIDCNQKRPTINWKKNIHKLSKLDSDFYSLENLNKIDDILDVFFELLKKYTKEKKASNIYNSAKKAVIAINKLEDKCGCFSTDEREVLAPFINEMVRNTGLKLEFDITEEWRNW